jgi:hypothetical protein
MTTNIQQVRQRIKSLPPTLVDALFSIQTAEVVRMTIEQNNIPIEKSSPIAQAIGLVLLGFIHPEDLAKEIQEKAGVAPQMASAVSSSFAAKIFSPLKGDLDKAYAPLLHPHEEAAIAPKIIQDVGPAPQIISRTATGMPALNATPIPSNMMKVAPPPMAPKKLPDVGWSKTTTNEPVVRLSQPTVPQSQGVAPRVAPPAPKQVAIPIKGPVGEFERIAIQSGQKNVAPPPPSSGAAPKPAASPEPAPIIIHEDAVFKAAQQPPNFRLQLPTEKFADQKSSVPTPMKPAVMELGKTAPSTQAVHYSEYKAPPPATPSTGPRQVMEITTQTAPRPPVAPVAPAPASVVAVPPIPKPPMPNTASKVIYKDYSEPTPPKPPQPNPSA